jgi:aminoglycoside phosphotransferase (APT) family kinase protein
MSAELSARITEKLGEHELEPLPGGHSGLTYTVKAGTADYVVKAVPPGQQPVGRNDMLRQAKVLRALEGSPVPVPAVITVDERPPAWFAMEFAPGEAIEPVLDEYALDPELARSRMLAAAAVLRQLHETGTGALDTDPIGAADELTRWSRTMHAVPEELRPGGEQLLRRLGDEVPADLPPMLVHGDFRLGNVLCVGTRPSAVVDWEIWSVGDRRNDLGWFLLFGDHRNFPALGKPVEGLPTEEELVEAYLGDQTLPLPSLRWFRALARMKMAAIMGHNLRRHREGKHHDPDQERLPPTIAAMIRTAGELLD